MANLFDVPQFIEDAPSVALKRSPNGAATPAAVVFDHVGKLFADARGEPHAALANVTLNVTRGEVFGIIGRSGAGKSTLLRLVNGLEKPSSGAVRVKGVSVGELDERGLVTLRRRIGMVFQHFNLLSAKTVRENIALPLKIAGAPKRGDRQKGRCAARTGGLVRQARRLSGEPVRRSEAAGRALRARWSPIRTFCFATKPPPHSIRKRPRRFSRCCATSIGGST